MRAKIFIKLYPFILLIAIFIFNPAVVNAQTYDWSGVCVSGEQNDVATLQGLECAIANIFTVFISLVGFAGFVMFIFGSIKLMLSGSDSNGTKSAKSILTYSVAGLVLALSAFIIINLLADFTGVQSIKTFLIPRSEWNW